MEAQAVRNSRAGDAFHYRWAARRCLALVAPNGPLKRVTVEGSDQPWKPGEYAIDLAEHYENGGTKSVVYHQLKHSTVRVGREFTFSELVPTFGQFAKRFSANLSATAKGEEKPQNINFSLVTNRPVAASIKTALTALRIGDANRSRRFLGACL